MNWLQREKELFLQVFKRLPVEIDHGEGVYLIDRQGKRYLDLFSGLGVNALGYRHPRILQALEQQMQRNLHLSNYFIQDVQIELAEKILQASGYDRIFFSNSGTESIEGIMKIVKKWARMNGRDHIICFQNAFHGRTLGALSITAQKKYQEHFEPLLPGVIQLPFNNVQALQQAANGRTAAIFLEFIQGEGGVVPATPEFAEAIADIQKRLGVLVVADEIQAGVGRTGKFLAFQHYPIIPDMVALAKAMGGGLPLGAFLVRESLAGVLALGEHGTTFGGNPLSCAAGLAVLQELEEKNLMRHVAEVGRYFTHRLLQLQEVHPGLIKEVRGRGLMLGMELTVDTFPLVLQGLEEGLILNSTAGNVLRFLPPLIIEKEHIDQAMETLSRILERVS